MPVVVSLLLALIPVDVALAGPPDAAPVTFGNASGTIEHSLAGLWRDFLEHLPMMTAGVVVIVLTWVAAAIAVRVTRRLLAGTTMRASFKDLIRHLLYITIWITGLMVAAIVIFPGITPMKLIGVLGLTSIAIGFAFKDIVENFLAGILILWRFPFDPGDYIECNDIMGKVEEITIRMTLIRQVDGQLVTIPNATLFKDPVTILTALPIRRISIIAGVAYDEDVDASREVIRKAVEACETVVRDRPVEIFSQEFAASSINFEVTWWTKSTPLEVRRSTDEVVAAVKRGLDEAGIEIPFPYRTLTFKHDYPFHLASPDRQALSRPRVDED